MHSFTSKEVSQLLYNKFVVILGDSIQRSVYKDLVRLLQTDSLLTTSQMKAKGELHFHNDHLIEGGVLGGLHNGTHYREVRQYRTGHHLVRFYFLTRVYSSYLESILDDFQAGPPPDVLILNSCVWDVSRYGLGSMKEYRANLETTFNRLDAVLPCCCLVIWNMTMPLGRKVSGGFLIPELQHLSKNLRKDIIEGNFYGATLAGFHLFDVVDLHYHFRHDLGNRVKDGIHWNNLVHRRITNLLLAHIADAWGVPTVPLDLRPASPPLLFPETSRSLPGPSDLHGPCPDFSIFQDDTLFLPGNEGSPQAFAGFTSFEDTHPPPFHPEGLTRRDNVTVTFDRRPAPPAWLPPRPPEPPAVHRTFLNFSVFQDDAFFLPGEEGSRQPFAGFTSFEDTRLPPFHPDALAFNDFHPFEEAGRGLCASSYPSRNVENIPPKSSRRRRRGHRVAEHHHGLVMRRPSFHVRDASPYRRNRHVTYRCY
ncbi:hypothetical protein JRQ81_017045 [Phrynocephalus forsythii]|uniref:PC-esterase domain-containing protein 1A n=1 Tax=Phrynocephalus forsythii TaxID=171643 RepID=A0A9Q0XTE9_9SAUR|nr:hypothetical protein JRQ81_017045 [Phrynocephalus forsythii]